MRVLWLCNMMLPDIAKQLDQEASVKEGWIAGTAHALLGSADSDITFGYAFPWHDNISGTVSHEGHEFKYFGFKEDTSHPEIYDVSLVDELQIIVDDFTPDMIHIFGTEYPHTLAMCSTTFDRDRILISIQGLTGICARHYYAGLPDSIIKKATFRDVVRRDSLQIQQSNFAARGVNELKALSLCRNVAGRTEFDHKYALEYNPTVRYHFLNETLRPDFYGTEVWSREKCRRHSIFISQGDYPIKGLHYVLKALPAILDKYPDTVLYVGGQRINSNKTVKDVIKISEYGKYINELLDTYGLSDKVIFRGKLNAAGMKKQLLSSEIFLCPSAIENSPNSLGEAMILGVPCVTTNVGGIPSIFSKGQDGIMYEDSGDPELTVSRLAAAVVEAFDNPGIMDSRAANARAHALLTHDPEINLSRMLNIYSDIVNSEPLTREDDSLPIIAMVSNYINHHQTSFCNKMTELTDGRFVFIQTEDMDEERIRMGWGNDELNRLPFLLKYREETEKCRHIIDNCRIVIFGGTQDESIIAERLRKKLMILRYDERMYKTGQWKFVSPRGLVHKYRTHTSHRKDPVYYLCAGAYVASDMNLIRAYSGKMYRWGYFPETRHYEDIDALIANKGYTIPSGSKITDILWTGRFIDWKHPEMAIEAAGYLKMAGIPFHLDMVGGGYMEETVKALISRYKLENEVTLHGFKTPAEVREFMERADIYLMTSDRQEGWGAVVNEAMNSGCTVVADHMVGSVPYLISHGVNGIIYNDRYHMSLNEALAGVADDIPLRRTLGRNAYFTIVNGWNAEYSALLLCHLAERLLGDRFLSPEKASALGRIEPYTCPVPLPCTIAPVLNEHKAYTKLTSEW